MKQSILKGYERLSTEKLCLLGVEVLHEFENGIRIIRVHGEEGSKDTSSKIRILNVKNQSETEPLQLDTRYRYYEHHGLLDLHEVCFCNDIDYGSLNGNILTGVIFDSKGNIVFNGTDIQRGISLDEFYKVQAEKLPSLLNYIEENINSLYSQKNNTYNTGIKTELEEILRERLLEIEKFGRYLVVKVHIDRWFICAIVFDTKENNKCVLRTYGAVEVPLDVSEVNKKQPYQILVLVTEDGAYGIVECKEEIISKKIGSIKRLYKKHKSDGKFDYGAFIAEWRKRYTDIMPKVYEEIDILLDSNGLELFDLFELYNIEGD